MTLERFERCEHGTPEFEACGICTIKEWNMDKKRSRQDWAQQIAFGMRDGAELSSEDCKQLFEILTAMPSARPEKGELEAMADQLHMAYGDMPKDRPPGPPTSIVARLRELASVSAIAPSSHERVDTAELVMRLQAFTNGMRDDDEGFTCNGPLVRRIRDDINEAARVLAKPLLAADFMRYARHSPACEDAPGGRVYKGATMIECQCGLAQLMKATDGGTHG